VPPRTLYAREVSSVRFPPKCGQLFSVEFVGAAVLAAALQLGGDPSITILAHPSSSSTSHPPSCQGLLFPFCLSTLVSITNSPAIFQRPPHMAQPKRDNSVSSDPSGRPKKTPISPQNQRKQARSLPPASSVHDEANNTARASVDASQRTGSPAEDPAAAGAGSSSGRSGGPPRWDRETAPPIEVVSRHDLQSIDWKKRRERGRGFLRGEAAADVSYICHLCYLLFTMLIVAITADPPSCILRHDS
jgi:hypothetical protein